MSFVERQRRFDAPFCNEAEVNYWLDLLDRFVMREHGMSIPQIDICCCRNASFAVVWKRHKFDALTGLAINGPYAGRLVDSTGSWAKDVHTVHIYRPITMDGASFNIDLALEHVNNLEIEEKYKKYFADQLTDSQLGYPGMLANLIEQLEYPIDKGRFLGNIRRENVYWDVTRVPVLAIPQEMV